jgi:hypothetical protein
MAKENPKFQIPNEKIVKTEIGRPLGFQMKRRIEWHRGRRGQGKDGKGLEIPSHRILESWSTF